MRVEVQEGARGHRCGLPIRRSLQYREVIEQQLAYASLQPYAKAFQPIVELSGDRR
jgi:hypothetical protein